VSKHWHLLTMSREHLADRSLSNKGVRCRCALVLSRHTINFWLSASCWVSPNHLTSPAPSSSCLPGESEFTFKFSAALAHLDHPVKVHQARASVQDSLRKGILFTRWAHSKALLTCRPPALLRFATLRCILRLHQRWYPVRTRRRQRS